MTEIIKLTQECPWWAAEFVQQASKENGSNYTRTMLLFLSQILQEEQVFSWILCYFELKNETEQKVW